MSEDHPNPFDITLVVKDGKEFQAHRNVLSQASPFFEKLLSTDMKENNEGVIRLEWITESQIAEILQFIYTGNVQISSQENAENLIATADYLLLSNLKTIAGKFLAQHMTTLNCISIYYSIAEQFSCEELIASTRKFINSNFTAVAASNEFLNLPRHEVGNWISSDDIVIDAEENVFEITLRWINHDKSERSVKFGELFRHVRLTTISRDVLLSKVVTNDLVKESENCLDSVTAALNWIDRSTDCDIPRPHSPRHSLNKSVIVITDSFCEGQCFYLPETDEWYRLPTIKGQPGWPLKVQHIVSCRGKVYIFYRRIHVPFQVNFDTRLKCICYDPELNRWTPALWSSLIKNNVPSRFFIAAFEDVLVVKNQICFIGQDFENTLWTYSLDTNLLTPLFNWCGRKARFCAVAVDRYIYVIGGTRLPASLFEKPLSECTRFDTEAEELQEVAPLKKARKHAFGVCKNDQIFIAGGWGLVGVQDEKVKFLKTCEVYNILTDEWQLIASLTLDRSFGSLVLVDETLYVLGGHSKTYPVECYDIIESYDQERDEWNIKEIVPVSKMISEGRKREEYFFKGCSLRVFKGVLNNLESIDRD
ncbi:kelch repeat and BTB domain-containing protein 12-like [Oculina patagonica]